jgi:hypothetical protein
MWNFAKSLKFIPVQVHFNPVSSLGAVAFKFYG